MRASTALRLLLWLDRVRRNRHGKLVERPPRITDPAVPDQCERSVVMRHAVWRNGGRPVAQFRPEGVSGRGPGWDEPVVAAAEAGVRQLGVRELHLHAVGNMDPTVLARSFADGDAGCLPP